MNRLITLLQISMLKKPKKRLLLIKDTKLTWLLFKNSIIEVFKLLMVILNLMIISYKSF